MRHFTILLIALLLATAGYCQRRGATPWKAFSSPVLGGGNFTLTAQKGSPVLLAFLALDAANQSPSRAAAVVLASLDHQYRNCGLRTVAMDATVLDSHSISQSADLINRAADWNLTFPILVDSHGGQAKAFQIRALPTIVLLSARGQELGRWEGYTRTPVLAHAIERLLGGPLGGLPDSALRPDHIDLNQASDETDAAAPGATRSWNRMSPATCLVIHPQGSPR